MKSMKKFAKIIVVFLFLFAIFFGIYYYYKTIYKLEGEAVIVEMNLPDETQNVTSAIDEAKLGKLMWKDAIMIKGWVFQKNVKSTKREVFLVLKSKDQALVFQIDNGNIPRPDVSTAYHLADGINNHGFNLNVPLSHLKENTYQVGFLIQDETGKYYTSSSKTLKISDGVLTVSDSKSAVESKPKSSQVSVTFKTPTGKISYNIEAISKSGNNLTISGWGFIQGMNSDPQKTYVLLKKNATVTVFSVGIGIRKDVTDYFKKSGLHLDSSGFTAQIGTESMEKGHYQVGLYIENGNQAGMIYSDKYLDIGK